MADRRSFLRGLASLPLIGGSVALIGSPSRAAVPITPALMDRYGAWLAQEHMAALKDRGLMTATTEHERERIRAGEVPMWWFPRDEAVNAAISAMAPSSRAAVILSAAGVPIGGVR